MKKLNENEEIFKNNQITKFDWNPKNDCLDKVMWCNRRDSNPGDELGRLES